MKRFFEIFRSGNYPQGSFSADDVKAIADNYDPGFLEAPITLDHGFGGPAYGWIDELKAEGKRLLASFKDVSDELTAMVANKRYKTHSVEIYNELDGKGPYLKALSMLGALTPAVKGMEPIEFSSFSEKFPEGESTTVDFDEPIEGVYTELGDYIAGKRDELDITNAEIAKAAGRSESTIQQIISGDISVPPDDVLTGIAGILKTSLKNMKTKLPKTTEASQAKAAGDPKTFTQAEVNEKLSQFEERILNLTNELQSQKQTSTEFKNENERIKFNQRKADFVSFLDAQTEAGKLPPKVKGKAATMFAHLDEADGSRGAADEPSALALFKEIIEGLPVLNFDERAVKDEAETKKRMPPEIAEKARQYAEQQAEAGHPVSFTQAVNHVKNNQNEDQ